MVTLHQNKNADNLESPPGSLNEAVKVWGKIGLLSFGGPAAQIALMHREMVENRHWLTEKQFLGALNFCMLLPGPEAMQLASYAGWRLYGWVGGLCAGLLFVLPGALIMLGLAIIYVTYGKSLLIGAMFLGVKAAVVVIVLEALLRISRRALKRRCHWFIAALAFVGIFFLNLPYPLIVMLAAVYGFFMTADEKVQEVIPIAISPRKTLLTIILWLIIWWGPVFVIAQLVEEPILTQIGLFFSKLATVTFGGAYAVLAYMAQDVVGHYGWLNAGAMMDGLGLAETTPGPLILVTEFVGFLAGYGKGGFWQGIWGASLTLWVTFVPCFLWIMTGAPYIEWISSRPRLQGALSAITAAVVGVILNLSLWFAIHVLFDKTETVSLGVISLTVPDWVTIDWRVILMVLVSGAMLLKFHCGIVASLVTAAALSVLLSFIF